MEIPHQYKFGFCKDPKEIIPVGERTYGEHVNGTIAFGNIMGIFKGSHKSSDGLVVLHFSATAICEDPRKVPEISENYFSHTVLEPINITQIPEGLHKYVARLKANKGLDTLQDEPQPKIILL